MERREFLIGLGAAAALAATAQANAEGMSSAGTAEMHAPMYASLQRASADCVSAGEGCLRHCFGMLSMNDASTVDAPRRLMTR